MRRALRRQLEILAEVWAAQARIDNELSIARAIQAGFLPRDPPGWSESAGWRWRPGFSRRGKWAAICTTVSGWTTAGCLHRRRSGQGSSGGVDDGGHDYLDKSGGGFESSPGRGVATG